MRPSCWSLALATVLAGLTTMACSPDHRPSFVLIVADTLRADFLGSYGFQGDVSPYLDDLAEQSVSFDSCVAPAPWTKPSIATLFTSLHPRVHGVLEHKGRYWGGGSDEPSTSRLPDSVETLAEVLSSAGYRTGAFVGNPWLLAEFGFAQGFEVYDDGEAGLLADGSVLLDRARRWLDEEDERPFFLYLHLMEPHGPYEAPPADLAALRESEGVGPRRPLTESELLRVPKWFSSVPPADRPAAPSLDYWRARYAAGVRQLDRRVGLFLERLRTAGDLERAWVVVASDHGESLAEHGYFEHGTNLFEDQVRVPLIVRPPGPPGATPGTPRREGSVVGLVDLAPTILSLAKAEIPARFHGADISELLLDSRGEEVRRSRPRIATAVKGQPHLYAVRAGRHKLVANLESGTRRLYDLEVDPLEQRNLRRKRPGVLREMEAHLELHLESVTEGRQPVETVPMPEETREKLEALGYLD